MNKIIHPSLAPEPVGVPIKRSIRADYIPPINYDWLPIKIEVNDRKKGTSINLHGHRFDRYFKDVNRWNFEISLDSKELDFRILLYVIDPIATNKSKKIIAGSLKRQTLRGEIIGKGAIHLLPPPTKCDTHRSIEILLDIILGRERKMIPSWRKDIEVPKIKVLDHKIENKIKDIQVIQQEISQLRSQIQEWDSYRDLLTATGDDLEDIVQRVLSDIGIKTKKTKKGFPADLMSKEVTVEITGIKGCVGVSSQKVIQTARFKESYYKEEKIILIANTYMDLSPKDREGKMDFSPEVEKYFESLSVCCLTTKTLFQLWKDVVNGKKDPKNVTREILNKNGQLTLQS